MEIPKEIVVKFKELPSTDWIRFIVLTRENESSEEFFERLKQEVTQKLGTQNFTLVDEKLTGVNELDIYKNEEIYVLNNDHPVGFGITTTVTANPSTDLRNIEAKLQHTWKTAVCELLDNSVQYTLPILSTFKGEKRQIDVIIDTQNRVCCINDNGTGVPSKNMDAFVRLAERQYHEFVDNLSYVSRTKEVSELIYNNESHNAVSTIIQMTYDNIEDLFSSQLSKWGVGSKYALARIGDIVTIYSQETASNIKSTIQVDNKDRDFKFDQFTEIVSEISHFTHIKVDGIDTLSFLNEKSELDLSKITSFGNSLAHTYYFYIVGFSKFFKRVIQLLENRLNFNISFEKFIQKIEERDEEQRVIMKLNNQNLYSLNNSINLYLEKAQDVFVFNLTFYTEKDKYNTVEEYGTSHYSKCFVLGVIFYFPYDREETKPKPFPEFEQVTNEEEDDSLVEYYWVGRLLPKITSTTSSSRTPKFMHVSSGKSKKIPKQCYQRVKGFFFLNRAFTPNQNKTDLVQDENSKIQQELFKHFQDPKLTDSYTTWLSKCHQTRDIEYIFHDHSSREHLPSKKWRHFFKRLEIPLPPSGLKQTIKAGDFVKLTSNVNQRDTICGEVSQFSFESNSESHDKQKNVERASISINSFRYAQKCKEKLYLIDEYHPSLINKDSFMNDENNQVRSMSIELISKITISKNPQTMDNYMYIPRDMDEFSLSVRLLLNKKNLSVIDVKSFKIQILSGQTIIAESKKLVKQRLIKVKIPVKQMIKSDGNSDHAVYNLSVQAVIEDAIDQSKSVTSIPLIIYIIKGEVNSIELRKESTQIHLQQKSEIQILFKDKANFINIPSHLSKEVERKNLTSLKLSHTKSRNANKFKFFQDDYSIGTLPTGETFIKSDILFELNEEERLNDTMRGEEVLLNCAIQLEGGKSIVSNNLKVFIIPGDFHRSIITLPSDEIENHHTYNLNPLLLDKWDNRLDTTIDSKDYSFIYDGEEYHSYDKLKVTVNSDLFYSKPLAREEKSDKIECSWKGSPIYVNKNNNRKIYYSSCSVNGVVFHTGDYFQFRKLMLAEESTNIRRKSFGYIEAMFEDEEGRLKVNGRWVFDPLEYVNLEYSVYFSNVPSNWSSDFPELRNELIMSEFYFEYKLEDIGKKVSVLSYDSYQINEKIYRNNPIVYQTIRFFSYHDKKIFFLKEEDKVVTKEESIICNILFPMVERIIPMPLKSNIQNIIWIKRLISKVKCFLFDIHQLSFTFNLQSIDLYATPIQSGFYSNCFILVTPLRSSIDQYNYTISADLILHAQINTYRKDNKISSAKFSMQQTRQSRRKNAIANTAPIPIESLPESPLFLYMMNKRVILKPSRLPKYLHIEVFASSPDQIIPTIKEGVLEGDYSSDFNLKVSVMNDYYLPCSNLKGSIQIIFAKNNYYEMPIVRGIATFYQFSNEKFTSATIVYSPNEIRDSQSNTNNDGDSNNIIVKKEVKKEKIDRRNQNIINNNNDEDDMDIDDSVLLRIAESIEPFIIKFEKKVGAPTKLELDSVDINLTNRRSHIDKVEDSYYLLLDTKYNFGFQLRDKFGASYNEADSKRFKIVSHQFTTHLKKSNLLSRSQDERNKLNTSSDSAEGISYSNPKLKSGSIEIAKFTKEGKIDSRNQYILTFSITIEIGDKPTKLKCEIPVYFQARFPHSIQCASIKDKTKKDKYSIPHFSRFPGLLVEIFDRHSNQIYNYDIELNSRLISVDGKETISKVRCKEVNDEQTISNFRLGDGKYRVLENYRFSQKVNTNVGLEISPHAESSIAKIFLNEKSPNFPKKITFHVTPSSSVPGQIVVYYHNNLNLPSHVEAGSEFLFTSKIFAEDNKTDLSAQFATDFEILKGPALIDNKFTKKGLYSISFYSEDNKVPRVTLDVEVTPSAPQKIVPSTRLSPIISPFRPYLIQNISFQIQDRYQNQIIVNKLTLLIAVYSSDGKILRQEMTAVDQEITLPNPRSNCRLEVTLQDVNSQLKINNFVHEFSMKVDDKDIMDTTYKVDQLDEKLQKYNGVMDEISTKEDECLKELKTFKSLDSEMKNYTPDLPTKKYKILTKLSSLHDFHPYSDFIPGCIGQLGSVRSELNTPLTHWIINYLNHIVIDGCGSSVNTPNRKYVDNLTTTRNWLYSKRNEFETMKIYALFPISNQSNSIEVINNDPQHRLKLPRINAHGFIDYAVNLIFLTPDQVAKDYRRRLWYRILGETLVFEKEEDATSFASTSQRSISLFSLDGFFLRDSIYEFFPDDFKEQKYYGFHGLPVNDFFAKKLREKTIVTKKLNSLRNQRANIIDSISRITEEKESAESKLSEYQNLIHSTPNNNNNNNLPSFNASNSPLNNTPINSNQNQRINHNNNNNFNSRELKRKLEQDNDPSKRKKFE